MRMKKKITKQKEKKGKKKEIFNLWDLIFWVFFFLSN